MTGPVTVNLWGEEERPFESAKDRIGTWPVTVWDCDHSDPTMRALKAAVGDSGEAREGAFPGSGCYDLTASIFNPAVALWALNCWAPEAGVCFDPFAGGGTRAIAAASKGLTYIGTELREEESTAVRARAESLGYGQLVTIHTTDARQAADHIAPGSADFLLTCPPYWTLERYHGGPQDLSELKTLAAFQEALYTTAVEASVILKPGALACWVIGLMRDASGALLPLHHTLTRAHEAAGYTLHEEVVLAQRNNGAIQRVGNFSKGNRYLVRTHEYLLVYRAPGGRP